MKTDNERRRNVKLRMVICKVSIKRLGNIIVNIILFALYVYFFGLASITKYLGDGVIVIKHEELVSSMSPGRFKVVVLCYAFCDILECILYNF